MKIIMKILRLAKNLLILPRSLGMKIFLFSPQKIARLVAILLI